MATLFQFALWIHIIAGFTAILILWIPILTKKGNKLHRKSGWVFVYSMTIISLTAIYMGCFRLFWMPSVDAGTRSFSWFLIYIAILSGASVWHGLRVLKFKRRSKSHCQAVDLSFTLTLLTSSIGIMVYGWNVGFPLLQYFPLIGLFLGGGQFIYWITVPKSRSHWVVEHISGMLASSIAAITAFVVFGAPRLLEVDSVNLLIWFLPTIVFTPMIIFFSSYYGRKFAGNS
uniref:DUF2306 domain-containing protein n=1 Tax=uncultured Allobacillus sp. TaxID=1638025 RepID=UPI002591565E|nr:DUF2306 domain-containing protein [uncultured Allobacillus sp.]